MDRGSVHWASVGQVVLAFLTIGTLGSLGLFLFFFGFSEIIAVGIPQANPGPVFMTAGILAGVGILALPSGYYGLMRILNRPGIDSRERLRRLRPGTWILAFPIVLLLGSLASRFEISTWLFLPLLHLFAIGIPIAWILYWSIRRLPVGSSQRMWGVFSVGTTVAPFIIMIIELLAGLGFAGMLVIYFASQPEFFDQLLELARELQAVETQEAMIEIITPFLTNPLVVGLIWFFAALVVPLIEELLKPIGVWLLIGRRLTPAAGFAAGALSGAGYGFVESLLLSSGTRDWGLLVLARIGTSAVHILTAGLMGWAIVQTWRRRRYFQLGMAYLGAVLIHGIWNGLTVLFALQALALVEGTEMDIAFIDILGAAAPLVLIFLSTGCFFLLLRFNHVLQVQQAGH